jgi:hypothetical protein
MSSPTHFFRLLRAAGAVIPSLLATVSVALASPAGSPDAALTQGTPALLASDPSGAAAIDIDPDHQALASVRLTNQTRTCIVVLRAGVNSPKAVAPIAPLFLAPGSSGIASIRIDPRTLELPCAVDINLVALVGSAPPAQLVARLRLTSSQLVLLESHVAVWHIGGKPTPVRIHVLQVPEGFALAAVHSTSPAFAARLAGNDIVVVPTSTAAQRVALVILDTVPSLGASHQSVLSAAILPVVGLHGDPARGVAPAEPPM